MELKYTITNKLSSVLGCRTGLPCKQWLPASICLLLFVSALYTGKRKQSWMLKVERWKRSPLRKPDGQTNIIFQKNFLFVYATNTMKSESRFRLLSFFLGKFFRLRKVFQGEFFFFFLPSQRSCYLLSIILNYFIYSPWHLAKILTLIHLLVLRLGKDQSSSFFSFPYAIHFVVLYFKFSVATSERKMFCMLMNEGKLRHKTAKVLKHLHGDA